MAKSKKINILIRIQNNTNQDQPVVLFNVTGTTYNASGPPPVITPVVTPPVTPVTPPVTPVVTPPITPVAPPAPAVVTPAAASSPVTITTNSSSLSYQQLLQTLNYSVYSINKIYLQSGSFEQLTEPLTVTHRSQSGELSTEPLTPMISPMQRQAAINARLEKGQLQIDGLTTLSFTLLAGEYLEMWFEADVYSTPYGLGADGSSQYMPGMIGFVKQNKRDFLILSACILIVIFTYEHNKRTS